MKMRIQERKKEIDFDNFKVDVADSIDGKIIVQEVKKSSKFKKVPGCSFYSIFTRLKSPELMLGEYCFFRRREKEKKWCWMKLPKKSWTQL